MKESIAEKIVDAAFTLKVSGVIELLRRLINHAIHSNHFVIIIVWLKNDFCKKKESVFA